MLLIFFSATAAILLFSFLFLYTIYLLYDIIITQEEVIIMFEKSLEKAKKFTLLDYSLLKIVLLLFGIIIGTLASGFFEGILWFLIVLFVILYVILMFRYLKK